MNKHQSIYDSIIKNGYQNRDTLFEFEIEHVSGKHRRYHSFYVDNLFDKISSLEIEVLSRFRKKDRILDIGAGAGRVSMYLQKKGYNITALEKSAVICNILRKRGIKKVVKTDIFKYLPKKKYDVVLFINVYSVFGKKKENITKLLNFLKEKILNKNGELIFILKESGSKRIEVIKRRFIFKEKIGPWFESIYPFAKDITKLAKKSGFFIKKFEKDEFNKYFLILKNKS